MSQEIVPARSERAQKPSAFWVLFLCPLPCLQYFTECSWCSSFSDKVIEQFPEVIDLGLEHGPVKLQNQSLKPSVPPIFMCTRITRRGWGVGELTQMQISKPHSQKIGFNWSGMWPCSYGDSDVEGSWELNDNTVLPLVGTSEGGARQKGRE